MAAAYDGMDDAALVQRANAGDSGAFGALYERHHAFVFRVALRILGNFNAAEDIAAEAFRYWLRQFPGFVLRARVTTFLYPVVTHLALAERKKRHNAELPLTIDIEGQSDLGTEELRSENLRSALAHLPEGQREVLLLRFVDDLALEAIAEALEIPLGTVKSRLHLALKRLRSDPRARKLWENDRSGNS